MRTREARFAYPGSCVRVRVRTADDAALTWLEEFLRPAFASRSDEPAAEVVFRSDEGAFAELEGELDAARSRGATRRLPTFALDTRVVIEEGLVRDGSLLVLAAKHRAFLRLGADGVELVAHPAAEGARGALMRTVREIAAVRARLGGRRLELHATAFSVEGAGLAVAGAKRAGKTTLALHALDRGDAALLGNDRAWVDLGGAEPRVRGMPTAASLRADARARFPELERGLPDVRFPPQRTVAELRADARRVRPYPADRPLRLSPAALADALGVELAADAPLRAVLLPRIAGASAPWTLEPLGRDEARRELRAARFGRARPASDAPTVFESRFGARPALDGQGDGQGGGEDDAAWADLAARVPVFRVRLGPRARERGGGAAALFDAVLEALRV